MNQTQLAAEWTATGFTAVEWDLVVTTWANVSANNQVVFGPKAPVDKNMKALLTGLAKSDKTIAKYLKQGLPSRSKKYKRIHSYVTRQSKGPAQDDGQASDEENEQQFNSDDERQLFGEDQQSRLSIFQAADQSSPEQAQSI